MPINVHRSLIFGKAIAQIEREVSVFLAIIVTDGTGSPHAVQPFDGLINQKLWYSVTDLLTRLQSTVKISQGFRGFKRSFDVVLDILHILAVDL